MRRFVVVMTFAVMIVATLATSELGRFEAQEKPKGDVESGKALYVSNCQKCHGPNGEGVPKMYRLVKATIVHLGSKQAQDQSDDFIRKSMTEGYKKMEAIKDPRPLKPEEVENILAFVRTLKQ